MASRHAQQRLRTIGSLTLEGEQQAEARRAGAEQTLQAGERLLGTGAQVSGDLFEGTGVSAAEAPYVGRYVLDEGAALQSLSKRRLPELQAGMKDANDLLDRAQELARVGNTQGAEELRAQAEGALLAKLGGGAGAYGSLAKNLFSLQGNPELEARAQLSSPTARTVGGMVQTGQALTDPMSDESQRILAAIQGAPVAALEQGGASAKEAIDLGLESSLRSLNSGARGIQRQVRDLGASRGGAARPFQEMALSGRMMEQIEGARAQAYTNAAQSKAEIEANISTQKAAVLAESGKWFESFRQQYATNATALAQSFLQNQGGIREQFQGALDNLAALGAQLGTKMNDTELAITEMSHQEEMMKQQFRLERAAFFEQSAFDMFVRMPWNEIQPTTINQNLNTASQTFSNIIGSFGGMLGGGG